MKKKSLKQVNLPSDIIADDMKYPDWKKKTEALQYDLGNSGQLTFYQVDGRRVSEWCLATLPISRGRNGMAERTYGVKLSDGEVVTIGNGPHVQQVVTIYIKKNRLASLQKYIDLYREGMVKAGQIRDRIGSRRAQGQLHRAAGRSSWLWD